MEGYSIGDVCRLLGVKTHVVRYWEQEIPLLSPRKDQQGKRIYLSDDVHLLFRIRFLVQEEKLTIEGVKQRLWKEFEQEDPDWRSRIQELRRELLRLHTKVVRQNGDDGKISE